MNIFIIGMFISGWHVHILTIDSMAILSEQERKRAKVLDEQHRRLQEAAAVSSVADDESTELTAHERELAMKSMGTMDEGDAILGSGAEVNLESQVSTVDKKSKRAKR